MHIYVLKNFNRLFEMQISIERKKTNRFIQKKIIFVSKP